MISQYLNCLKKKSIQKEDMKSLSIIFPMAGNGMRFGGTFKPFLDATEKKFIELAV